MRKVSLLFVALVMGALSLTAVQAQDNVIKIASQSPLSGPQSSLGIGISNGVELAIEQLSGPLEELGFTVEYVPFDDEATPDKGVSNAQQIVADPAILGVVGHLNSGVAIPSSEVYNDSDLVMVSPANTNPTVTDRGYATVNRVCGRDDLQGPTGAQYAFDNGVTSVYVLDDTTAYGVGLADFFQAKAEELGITVLGRQGTAETANFDSIVTPILALAPDMIYFGGIYSQTGIFISQARAAGFEGLYMGGDGFDSPDFADLAGDAGVGTLYTSTAGPASLFPNAAQFIEDYTAKYGEAPRPYSTEAYDSTAVILAAIEVAINEAGGTLPTRAAVAAAVRATDAYEGLTGPISFDANGDRTVATYYVLSVASANKDEWGTNEVISQVPLESPLTAAGAAEGPIDTTQYTIAELVTMAASSDTPEFTTLLAAVAAADPSVLEALSNPDAQLTVFAPVDAAFAAVDPAALAGLLADPAALTDVLLYHVVDGAVLSTDLTSGAVATLLEGASLDVVVENGAVTVNGANVVVADVPTKNGVIHVIDAVLLPSN